MNDIPKLDPQQGVVYCWKHDANPNVVKIGKSTVKEFYKSVISTSKRWLLTPPEILGFQIFPTADEAHQEENKLHLKFGTVEDTEFVRLTGEVKSWIENECIRIPLKNFQKITQEAYRNRNRKRRSNPEFKRKEREYRANQSQRKRDREASEIARKEAIVEKANAVIAELTQGKKDE